MAATIHSFNRTQCFPERIEACLQASDWGHLDLEIQAGFDPGITAYGGLSLFESILHRSNQDGYVPPLCLPATLLQTLVRQGLGQHLPCGKPAVVACVEYGQWKWAHLLLDEGFTPHSEHYPVLDAMALGRAQRCEDAVVNQIRDKIASSDGNTDAQRAAERERRFSMAMMEYAKLIYAKDARSVFHIVQRLVGECGVDPQVPLKMKPLNPAGDRPGIRNIPNALDNAILRQDEAMAFALIGAGASVDGAVMVDQPKHGPVACRPIDMALSARCYDLFIHILDAHPDGKHPLPGSKYPSDPASFPLAHVMISSLLAMENAAPILDELLRSSQGHWSADDLAGAMHMAARAGHVGMMKSLAAQGIGYDVPTSNGFKPIHQACSSAKTDAIDFLLSKGASLSDQSNSGVRAHDLLQACSPQLAAQYAGPAASNVVVLRPRPRP